MNVWVTARSVRQVNPLKTLTQGSFSRRFLKRLLEKLYIDFVGRLPRSKVGNTASLVGNTASLVGNTASLVGNTASLVGNSVSLVGNTVSLVGNTVSLVGNTVSLVRVYSFSKLVYLVPGTAVTPPSTITA